MRTDVVVLGAGVAGLHAAGLLARRGLRVVVLEARDRVGGRVCTVHEPGWPAIEAGAEFVHGRPPVLERLLRQAGLSRVALQARHTLHTGRGRRRADRLWEQAMALLGKLPGEGPDQSFDRLRARAWWRRLAAPPVHRLARSYVEGFNAAPASDLSVSALHQQSEAAAELGGDRLFHVRGGYGQLPEALLVRARRAGAHLHTGAIVERVEWRPGRVQVYARGALGHRLPVQVARTALLTLPIGVLQARPPEPGAVRFSPALPAGKRAAIAAGRMGAVVRVLLRFAHAEAGRWSLAGARGFDFLHVPGGAFPTFWRATAPEEPAVVTAWAGGPAATRLPTRPRPRLRAAIRTLARGLEIEADVLLDDLAGWCVFDWQDDPYARGAYSYAPVGARDFPAALAAPVANTLFFAGEATHPGGMTGTVHGALETAQTATRALAAALSAS